MSKEMRIWRCLECNNKTHRRLWEEGITCPICGLNIGHSESYHGGLDLNAIERERARLMVVNKKLSTPEISQPPFLSKERK